MNTGYLEAKQLFQFDCVVFHDVDMIPEDDRKLLFLYQLSEAHCSLRKQMELYVSFTIKRKYKDP